MAASSTLLRHTGVRQQLEAGVQRFGDGGTEGVEVDWRVGAHTVERENPNPNPNRVVDGGEGCGQSHECHLVVVPGGESGSGAAQTPHVLVPPKAAVHFVSLPLDSSVGHLHLHQSPLLHLPVRASRHVGGTQQLPAVKPVRVIGVQLTMLHQLSLCVVVGQLDLSVGSVQVQLEFTWERTNITQLVGTALTLHTLWT